MVFLPWFVVSLHRQEVNSNKKIAIVEFDVRNTPQHDRWYKLRLVLRKSPFNAAIGLRNHQD